MSSTGWRICQFYQGPARNGWNHLKLVEHSWISLNALAIIGSEESVVEDSYHVLNWLENMSILSGSGTEWLELVETG
jgi:hypothetical protein